LTTRLHARYVTESVSEIFEGSESDINFDSATVIKCTQH